MRFFICPHPSPIANLALSFNGILGPPISIKAVNTLQLFACLTPPTLTLTVLIDMKEYRIITSFALHGDHMFLRIKCHDRLVLHCCEQRIGCCRNACIVLFEKAAEHQDLQRRECDAVLCVQDGERARCGVQLDGALSAEGLADKWLIWLEKWHVQCPPTCSTGTPLAFRSEQ